MGLFLFSLSLILILATMFVSVYCQYGDLAFFNKGSKAVTQPSIRNTKEDRLFFMAQHIVSFNCSGATLIEKNKRRGNTIKALVFRIKKGELLSQQDYRLLGALTVNEALVAEFQGKLHLRLVFDGKYPKQLDRCDQIIDFIDFDFNHGNPLPELTVFVHSTNVGQRDAVFVKIGEEIEKRIAMASVPI